MLRKITSRPVIFFVSLSLCLGVTAPPHVAAGIFTRTIRKVALRKAARRAAMKRAAKRAARRTASRSVARKIAPGRVTTKAGKKISARAGRPLHDQIVREANRVAAKGGKITRSQQTALVQNLPVVKRRGVRANRVMRKHFSSTAKNNTNAKKRIIKQWEQKSGRTWPVRKGRAATLHHIVPLESGGANKWWNAMPTFGKAPNHSLKRVPGPHAKGGILRKTIQAPRKKMLQKGAGGKVSGQYKEWDLRTPYKKH